MSEKFIIENKITKLNVLIFYIEMILSIEHFPPSKIPLVLIQQHLLPLYIFGFQWKRLRS